MIQSVKNSEKRERGSESDSLTPLACRKKGSSCVPLRGERAHPLPKRRLVVTPYRAVQQGKVSQAAEAYRMLLEAMETATVVTNSASSIF